VIAETPSRTVDRPGLIASGAGSISGALFVGFAIASIGGPLALLTFFPGTAGEGVNSAGRVVVLALALFAAPLGIWLAYSKRVVAHGGLTAFVAAATNRPAALVHGWIWAFAYFLYLPYTVTFVVYDLLAPVFPGIAPYRGALEFALPVVLILIAFSPVVLVVVALAVLALTQLGLLGALAVLEYANTSARVATGADAATTGRAAAATALLFVCASLPVYLGPEVRGGSRTIRRGLVAAVTITGIFFLLAAAPLARVPAEFRDAAVPGAAIAQAYGGRPLAVTVGLVTAASVLALIVAEYLALARLLHWLHGLPIRTLIGLIALPFLALDALSLLDPQRFYTDLLKPSLAALFLSLFIVSAVFPRLNRRPVAIAAATIASGLALWGLYTLFAPGTTT
jgi:hypothetical protein